MNKMTIDKIKNEIDQVITEIAESKFKEKLDIAIYRDAYKAALKDLVEYKIITASDIIYLMNKKKYHDQ